MFKDNYLSCRNAYVSWITVFFLSFLLVLSRSCLAADEEPLLDQGRSVYEKYCAACHGVNGDGQGEVASQFLTKPRSFLKAEFKIKSTPSGSPPSDQDLIGSVRNGLPGTAMVAHDHLSEQEIRAVVVYIKNFSSRFLSLPRAPIILSPAPPVFLAYIAQGKRLYQKSQCHQCHGIEGKGDGILAKDLTVRPADFTRRPLKSGPLPQNLARTILTGFEGTPMPPYQFILNDQEIWALAYYIHSLGRQTQETADEKKGKEIVEKLRNAIKGETSAPIP